MKKLGAATLVISAFVVVLIYLGRVLVELDVVSLLPKADTIAAARLVDRGLYRDAKVTERQASPGKATFVRFGGMMLDQSTNEIPAQLGKVFGVRYIIEGQPERSRTEVKIRVRHPEFTGDTRQDDDQWKETVIIGETAFAGWIFEEKLELVPGQWSVEIADANDRPLLNEQFTVVEPHS